MAGERRNGNLLVQLGPRLQAYPEELLRQRRTHDGTTEYLVRWTLVTLDEDPPATGGILLAGGSSGDGVVGGVGGGGGSGAAASVGGALGGGGGGGSGSSSTAGESKAESILMWMSTEDVYANCPTLLGKKRKEGAGARRERRDEEEEEEEEGGRRRSGEEFPTNVTFDEGELSDMKGDVKSLVLRARKQMSKKNDFSIHHTIHVLSAYAAIGSLVGEFKETGALDLLMELLCNKERQTRRSAGKMLRALASHDAGSRAYVLLSLSQQDGIEQHMDFDNRYTLLELFAETTSSEEHGISFDGIHLPQIPGKLLFSLVKRYLCVTSLMDKLNTVAGAESSSERQDKGPSPSASSSLPSSSSSSSSETRLQREFDFSLAMANLISELVRVMGWDRNLRMLPHPTSVGTVGGVMMSQERGDDLQFQAHPSRSRSIFQLRLSYAPPPSMMSSVNVAPMATGSSCSSASGSASSQAPKKKLGAAATAFKTRTDFASRSAYVEYVQDHLKSGMMVRMLEDYEEVSAGDVGDFRYSNDGSPPVQAFWTSLARTYWVHWHMIEILGNGNAEQAAKETQEKASSLTEMLRVNTVSQSFFCKPPGGLYSLPYLEEEGGCGAETPSLNRAEWWELLFFIKKLEPRQQQEVTSIITQKMHLQYSSLDDSGVISVVIPVDLARVLLLYLRQHLPSSSLPDLLCSHCFAKHRGDTVGLELPPPTECSSGTGGAPGTSFSSSTNNANAASSSSSEASSSSNLQGNKKANKEAQQTGGESSSGPGSPDAEGELPAEDLSNYPEDLEDKMKVFSIVRLQSKKTCLEKLGEVMDLLKKNQDSSLQLAAMRTMLQLLEQEGSGGQDRSTLRSDSPQSIRDKLLKLLVELLSGQSLEIVTCALRLTYQLMVKHEWRVSFATEGGVKAVLSCMQEFPSATQLQQIALATLKVLTGASKYELRNLGSSSPLTESGQQVVLEIFASIGSATPQGSPGLLGAIPAAIKLMQSTKGCTSAVCNGLLVLTMLISNHQSLAEQLSACDVKSVLTPCLSASRPEMMLAIIALKHLSVAHKQERKEFREDVNLKETEFQMLVCSLKEMTATKEVILTLEQLLCDLCDTQVTRDFYQELVRLMDQHRADRAVQLSILRILNMFLDNYQEDLLPWHESIEPCLSSMNAFISDREVVQLFIRFLYRLASLNKDYAVVMCRLGTKDALVKALDKHSATLLMVPELRELVTDCEKYASLYKKMTTSVLAGCIQMVLGQIEEHRRSHQPINIPFFDLFLRNLCQGSSIELKEDKCWEKVEVSSNHHRAHKLTDKNPKTYWESNGCTGSHFINIYMHKGIIIRQLSVLLASEDSSYMPARILVQGGDDPTNINTELNTVNVSPTASRVVLVQNLTRFWPIIQIRVKRCQQGGIDTRVHGFEVLGPKPTFWPVFKEQLCCRTFLFYSTKAHTWCQEILEDRNKLLQLFTKLNNALRHEQMFAERFLPDIEAAEALGRTCWEALITPIVHSITAAGSSSPLASPSSNSSSSDRSRVSPLSWLISEYLDNTEAARRPQRCREAVFNSRVRRLTHLLVHADTAHVDTSELRPPVKSKGINRSRDVKNGKEGKNKDGAASSTSAALAASSSAKTKMKASSSITGIALSWQGVVQSQVKSFLDLWCGHPDFVERYRSLYLRLRKGMEELFGMHTAFMLALRNGFSAALLQMSVLNAMHVSERFAQYIDRLIQDSGRDSSSEETLRRLHQFLEPMLFLSGLELAATFEHFYRYYMADRLLMPSKLWLEKAVVEEIGACFPNRYPQQMLRSLRESQELQQEFHLYQLQKMDRALDDEDTELMEDWAPSEAASSVEETEVQILVLSPRCWAIPSLCHLDHPDKLGGHLQPQLASYLKHFTDFYMHSQCLYGGVYSTHQAKPRRLQWTWLGHAELSFGSLTLYVSTVQMFILLHFNQKEEVSVEHLQQNSGLSPTVLAHALSPLTGETGVLTASHPDQLTEGTLRLTQQALCDSSDATYRWRRLLPRQTYLSVDEDAAQILERKRNFLYCLIVRILKEERELHIDNLVFMVLESCHKHEAPVRFSCSTMDVLSCVTHVISRGYAQRNEDSPHILQYLPEDPSTPQKGQAQISFSRLDHHAAEGKADISLVERCRRSSSEEEVGVLEALHFSLGRTLSQEEVRALMLRTVEQVSATLSLDADRARHLLVHCRWSVDLLVQRHTDDPDALATAAGLKNPAPDATAGPSSSSSEPQARPPSTCPVCLVTRSEEEEEAPTLCCMHYCCKSCWQKYLTARIEQNLLMNCDCPITYCRAQPTSHFYYSILTDKDTIAKYEASLLRGYVECCSNLTWCTNPQGCDQILCKENLGSMGTCSKCCWASCFSCNFPEAHYPASCSHMSQWLDDGGFYEGMSAEAQSKHLAKLISKRCPSCQAQIEKNEGCLHMTCAKCNHGFCWRCLKPWKPTHKDYYNCSAMVSKAARQEKKFQDYNERCTFHNQAKDFAISLQSKVSSINEALQMKSLSFVIDACKALAQARKVLAYSCVYSYYNQDTEKMDTMEQQVEALDLHANALQILLEDTLLQSVDLASCVRLLKPEHLSTGQELNRRIQERLMAILQHSTQDFRVGCQSKPGPEAESAQGSNISNKTDANKKAKSASDSDDSDNNNREGGEEDAEEEDEDDEYDEEYVPEWHEDYDEDDIDEDDFFSEDDESENLERDFSPFD